MRIAIFDYFVDDSNAIGKLHRMLIAGLCREYEFTVFSVRFDNPDPARCRWVPVSVPLTRPLLALAVGFRVMAARALRRELRRGMCFDLLQNVEGNAASGDLVYAHFCHRHFLKTEWPHLIAGQHSLRVLLREMDHRLRAVFEARAYARGPRLVVPSQGLRRELEQQYPCNLGPVRVISNPINSLFMTPPANFDRQHWRKACGFAPASVGLVFAALGQFERKGLPLLLDALRMADTPNVRVVVVGGQADLVRTYQQKAIALGVADRVRFVGLQKDVRPYLWAADGFVLNSWYEVFPVVALEAAAAGLPVLATPLSGVEEFLEDGINGLELERSVVGVATALKRFVAMTPEARAAMGGKARESVRRYAPEQFIADWRAVYARVAHEHT